MKLTRNLAIALEIVGCCITLAGIVTEWVTQADYGYVIITGGALVVTFGSMIRLIMATSLSPAELWWLLSAA